jgi:hypothetical protein
MWMRPNATDFTNQCSGDADDHWVRIRVSKDGMVRHPVTEAKHWTPD